MKIDINCDMGESFGAYRLGHDAEVMPYITSANIACGYHAGDPLVMAATVKLAQKHGVGLGAHPGHPDLQGFGRRSLDLTPEEAEAIVLYQIGALAAFAKAEGGELTHVKAHGALYNQAAKDPALAAALARGVARFSKGLILVGLAGSAMITAAQQVGLRVANEAFPDRDYNPDGSLRSRRQPGAVLDDPVQAVANGVLLATKGIEITEGGKSEWLSVQTLCIHGDTAIAAQVALRLKNELQKAGVEVTGLAEIV
jgi:UPF0271 protein